VVRLTGTDCLAPIHSLGRPRGRSGTATAFYSTANFTFGLRFPRNPRIIIALRFGAGCLRIESPGRLSLLACEGAKSPLAGHRNRRVYLHFFRIPPHSRGAEFVSLGLQSYSRPLCLSSVKHNRLYP